MGSEQITLDAKAFATEKLRPFAKEFEDKQEFPRNVIDELGEKGFLGATFPEQYGGLGLNALEYGALTEEIGKGDPTTRSLLTVHTSLVGESLLKWANEEQKNKWLPDMACGKKIGCFALTEPTTGTDAKSVQTTYERKNGSYVINGKKKWISFSGIADFYLVIARDDKNISAFIVEKERPGVSVVPLNGLLAAKAAHISEITFDNVEIPAENLISKEGAGFTYIVNTALDHGRYSIAWGGLSLSQAALEEMTTYARNRSQFGQKIHKFQHIQAMIGDAVTKVHAGRALCQKAGELRVANHPDAVMETNIAKYFTSKIAMEIATDAVQVHGGNGCYNEFPVERLFREAKILEIIEGTSQVQQNIISLHGLRRYYLAN